MKRIALFVLGGVLVSTSALAQAPDAAVETALLAAPANLREGATAIKWKPDFTYDHAEERHKPSGLLRPDGFPEQQPFSVECTSVANLDRVAQNLKFEASGDKVKTKALLDAAESDGTRVKPSTDRCGTTCRAPTGSTLART